ncbi:hypothetical protein X781_2860 [Mannheimia sp. USDA-ARS-USMARC-1261]|nr:hypothetical protein X781_2860 [Mannheimia sp. USDA-ARS-USMARC-1261]
MYKYPEMILIFSMQITKIEELYKQAVKFCEKFTACKRLFIR